MAMADGTDRPLGRYRVIELAGPVPMHCGKLFADLGAEVIKVEPPRGGPIKPSAPYQTWFHAGTQAAAATLLALRQRRRTGHGAHVDQAMRDTGIWMLTHTYQFWDMLGVNLTRQGASRDMGGVLRL